MAEKNRYPQIPSTVWWGVRSILQRTPKAKIDERLLCVQLGVQEVAARAYMNELRHVGLVTEDGKATPLADRWRLDATYAEAVKQIVENAYPEGLLHIAPPGEAERQKVVSWFQHEGLGQGAAGNKAAAYLLISSPTPNEAPRVTPRASQGEGASRARPSRPQPSSEPKVKSRSAVAPNQHISEEQATPHLRSGIDVLPLNVNVQIHISADAGTEQIESIFQAMRRYLYDAPAS